MRTQLNLESSLIIISLASSLYFQNSQSTAVFALCCALLAFKSFLDRKRQESLVELQNDIQQLKNRMEAIQLNQGFKR